MAPMYEYRCPDPKCNYQFDDYSPLVSNAPRTCPKCGKLSPVIFSAPGRIEMKGKPWNA